MSKDLTAALQELMQQQHGTPAPPAPKPRGAAPHATGAGLPAGQASGGGSIAGPLTEDDYAARTYHLDRNVQSSDGLLTFRVKPIKSIAFADANGNALVVNYAEPTS
ncbi:hypothetical protein [Azonexus sp.]|uniref:hypothetical protein n=1 Tax=Azonexus sp. TaxID=1872668 RepID=UPI00281A37AA|nr:hypothetical protein [Azonexus sp.]MDR1995159.1 putative molybdenum carrier protein [Azonexus sp.]